MRPGSTKLLPLRALLLLMAAFLIAWLTAPPAWRGPLAGLGHAAWAAFLLIEASHRRRLRRPWAWAVLLAIASVGLGIAQAF